VFIVDAYNLAYSTGRATTFEEAYRLVLELAHRLIGKGYRVLFVFDGYNDTPHPRYIKFAGERRAGMSADEWILEYVKKHRGETIKLITRDKALAERSRHLHPNLLVIDPKDFMRFANDLFESTSTPMMKEVIDTYDIQMRMLNDIESFLESIKRKKRKKRTKR